MRSANSTPARSRGSRLVLASLAVIGLAAGAAAQTAPGPDQIADALKPKGLTRSLSLGPSSFSATAKEDAAFIDSIQARPLQPLSSSERDKLAAVSTGRPTIDLEIPFDFNSATIGPKALPVVKNLGAALARPELKGGTYTIAGHTDGVGSDGFNQDLSERRAEAVKRYIVTHYGLPAKSLITVGFGKSRLKDPRNPQADVNRRVQATNISDIKSAGR